MVALLYHRYNVPRMLSINKISRAGLYVLIFLLPFSTLITVWLASQTGHLYIWSAWAEIVIAGIALGAIYRFITDKNVRTYASKDWLTWLIVAYVLLHFLFVAVSSQPFLALIGTAFNTRFLILFASLRLLAHGFRDEDNHLQKWILYMGMVMGGLALVQVLLLPADFLTNFGYDAFGLNTSGIPPAYHAIGSSDLIRAQATMRGPNALGAYFILPLSIAGTLFMSKRLRQEKIRYLLIGVLLALGLMLTFSRSAWLAALVSAGVILALDGVYKRKAWLIGTLIALVIILPIGLVSREMPAFKTLVLHETSGTATNNSTPEHFRATKEGLQDIIRHPLGEGPGSAGPVSALHKGQPSQIAENYFVQIAQEVGILGLLLLLTIHGLVAQQLWRRRRQTSAQIALAAFLGLIVANLMLHIWADSAVAVTWWGFASIVLTSDIMYKKRKYHEEETKKRT